MVARLGPPALLEQQVLLGVFKEIAQAHLVALLVPLAERVLPARPALLVRKATPLPAIATSRGLTQERATGVYREFENENHQRGRS
jgi:hypothetical protein